MSEAARIDEIASTSCCLTQEVSQDLNKACIVAVNGMTNPLAFQSGLLAFESRIILPMPRYSTTTPVQIISLKWNFEKLLLVTCSPTKACFAILRMKGQISPILHCLQQLVFGFVQSNNA